MTLQDLSSFSANGVMPLAERQKPEVRDALSGVALKAFFKITEQWDLLEKSKQGLLGFIPEPTYYKWKKGQHGTLSYDTLERISLILGIYKALKLLFLKDEDGVEWLKRDNSDMPFGGLPPIERMINGGIDGLYSVRRYLDAWRGIR